MSAATAINTLVDTRTGRAIDLAMQKLEVSGRVYPIGSFVRVTHRFKCLGTQPMEAIYIAALPTGGTLRRFKVVGENFEVDSKLEPRKKARADYEKGMADGHLSVLAETNQDGLVHLSVGQVQPDEEISVVMDVVVGVTTRDKGFQFRYPFTLAPNYHAQAKMSPTADGGGGRIELPEDVFGDLTLPEWKAGGFGLHEVSFNIQVCCGTNLATVSSPSHRIAVSPQKDGSSLISLAGAGDTPDRDLVLDVSVPEASPVIFADATLLGDTPTGAEPKVPTDAGRWTAMMPSSLFQKAARQPRRVCFVVDRSGSMTGSRDNDPHAPILGAKQALLACISALQPDDEFGIVHFGSDAECFHPTLAKADDTTRKKAQTWVQAIRCNGGTEMLTALAAATRVLGGPGGDVFVLTDGEVFQTGPIVEHMAASQSRVHVLGIGTASQHRFMAQLARRTNGVCEMVSPQGDVGMAGLKLFNQVQDPILTDPTVTVDGTDIPNVGTVWMGLPLLVTDPKGDGSLPGGVLVAGQVVAGSSFVQVKVPDGLTALLWAGRQIEDLCSKIDMVGPGTPKRDNLEKRMETLSVSYGLASRVMSLVAVVERVGDQAGVTPEQKVVAVGVPEGMDAGFFGAGYQPPGVHTKTMSSGLLRSFGITNDSSGSYANYEPTRSRSVSGDRGLSLCSVAPAGSLGLDSDVRTRGASDAWGLNMRDCSDDTYGSGVIAGGSGVIAVAACASAPAYDPDTWVYTGSLLTDIGNLKSDGGVPGYLIENRVLHTLLLALIVTQESKTYPGVYDQHIDKMVAFVQANQDVLGDKITLYKVMKALQHRECPVPRTTLDGYFSRTFAEVLPLLRTAF